MTSQEMILWEKIQNFEIDSVDAAFKFSTRLARENNWSIAFAKRVIDEYKKFIFLNCISNQGLTPSDAVDQAWHLHLTYTRSYWKDMCSNVLQREIHHNPTKGGTNENQKFDSYYSYTRDLYFKKFNVSPPTDIWPDNEERFSNIQFQRINISENLILKKKSFRPLIASIIGILIMGLFIQAVSEDYTFAVLIFFALIAYVIYIFIRENKSKRDRGGCSSGTSGCGSGCTNHNSYEGHSGDSGCSGSGCSGSGCSGCSGGGCGGD